MPGRGNTGDGSSCTVRDGGRCLLCIIGYLDDHHCRLVRTIVIILRPRLNARVTSNALKPTRRWCAAFIDCGGGVAPWPTADKETIQAAAAPARTLREP